MYDREYQNHVLTFEASGGLINASLVMQDRETDTYWSIMTNSAIRGPFTGTELSVLPTGVKMRWSEWRSLYPNSKVLSVNGMEDAAPGYGNYFYSDRVFGGVRARDRRFSDKELVYTFEFTGKNYVIPVKEFAGGKVFTVGDTEIFLFRPEEADLLYSTVAFQIQGDHLKHQHGKWQLVKNKCVFDEPSLTFNCTGEKIPVRMKGFDTYWYTLSLTNQKIELLR